MRSNMQDPGFVLRRNLTSQGDDVSSPSLAFATLKAKKNSPGVFYLSDFFVEESEIDRDAYQQVMQASWTDPPLGFRRTTCRSLYE